MSICHFIHALSLINKSINHTCMYYVFISYLDFVALIFASLYSHPLGSSPPFLYLILNPNLDHPTRDSYQCGLLQGITFSTSHTHQRYLAPFISLGHLNSLQLGPFRLLDTTQYIHQRYIHTYIYTLLHMCLLQYHVYSSFDIHIFLSSQLSITFTSTLANCFILFTSPLMVT